MVAPIIATGVSAIGSFLASKGMDLLAGVFRGGVNKGVRQISDTIKDKTGIDIEDAADGKLTEEQLARLKQFELENQELILDHEREMKALELEGERIHQQDRASARAMQQEAMKSGDPFASRFIYFYAVGITLVTFTYVFMITFVGFNKDNVGHIVDTVLGFLLGVSLSAIIQFFYGSSKGSAEKTDKMSELMSQMAQRGRRAGEAKEG